MNQLRAGLLLLLALAVMPLASGGGTARVERGNLILENVPSIPAELAERLSRRQEFHTASFLDWTGTGEAVLITAGIGAATQVYKIASPLGARQQLTSSDERPTSAVAQPNGEGFVYTKDQGGDEYYQLYFHNVKTGADALITDGKKSRNVGALWSRDGKQLAYLHSPEGTSRFQICIARAGSLTEARTIVDQDGALSVEDWSSDGKTLLVSKYVSMTESYMYVLSVTSGELSEINSQRAGAPKIAYNGGRYPQSLMLTGGPPRGGRFSPDGKSVYVISDQDSEFARLVRIDLSTGRPAVITAGLKWDVEGFDISPDGATIVYSVNEDGSSRLHVLNLSTGAHLPAPSLPPGIVGNLSFDRRGGRFAFNFYRATALNDVYVWNMSDRLLTRWSKSELEGIYRAASIEPELVRFSSFDGRKIAAFMYLPKGKGKFPVIINIHGGPEAQFRPVLSPHPYSPVLSGLELGFAVISPNVRGSTGYGKTFSALDDGMKREDAVKDIGALLDWIAAQPVLDRDRIVLYGASYGGYMVNASMARYDARVKAGVSIVAISDFYTFLENTAEYRRDLRRAEYGDERNPEIAAFLKRIAPLSRAQEISAPIFIIHGANDPRVPVTQAEKLFSVLKSNGAEPWLMIAKDEGHGFSKQANIIQLDEAVTIFLRQVVLGEGVIGRSMAPERMQRSDTSQKAF